MSFANFSAQLRARFHEMTRYPLFRVDVDPLALWTAYLGAFPPGTDPIYRVRTTHDGSYDRMFIKRLGNVVALRPNGTRISLWDNVTELAPYDTVSAQLSALVSNAPIADVFRTYETRIGIPNNVELKDGVTTQFIHYFADIPAQFVMDKRSIDTFLGGYRTSVQVLQRGVAELTTEALTTVLELIDSKTLYRGDEFRRSVSEFLKLKNNMDTPDKAWLHAEAPVARFRNTAIGTLVTALSEGQDLEIAVKAFESMVAPVNYRRPTALITQGMIDKALEKIDELGLRPSLDRRFAVMQDISVNDVFWVDNSVKSMMRDGLRDLLEPAAKKRAPQADGSDISIEDFVRNVLPTAKSVEALVRNALASNLVSLTTAVDPAAPLLFRWNSPLAWSYNGEVTDSIAEKVKAAGGNINAKLRVSLAWSNYDDLDLHIACPDGHVYYGAKRDILDVDMNAAGRRDSREPVENAAWTKPRSGVYTVTVDNYAKKETVDQGFALEVAYDGKVMQYTYPNNAVRHMAALQFKITANGISLIERMDPKVTPGNGVSREIWGIETEQFAKVNAVMASPNDQGNQHLFFILENCVNPDPARGFYNEFLKPELNEHRKVFEVLGSKTKCQPSNNQLSGLGFSSTIRKTVTFRVASSDGIRTYNVNF